MIYARYQPRARNQISVLIWQWKVIHGEVCFFTKQNNLVDIDKKDQFCSRNWEWESFRFITKREDKSFQKKYLDGCCCCLPCNHFSNWTWVVGEILAYGNRLRSTHCREFPYLKLCRPAYFVRTTQLLPHPGHE